MIRDSDSVHESRNPTVVVYGAYGHTARFIVDELRARRFEVVLSGQTRRGSRRWPTARATSLW